MNERPVVSEEQLGVDTAKANGELSALPPAVIAQLNGLKETLFLFKQAAGIFKSPRVGMIKNKMARQLMSECSGSFNNLADTGIDHLVLLEAALSPLLGATDATSDPVDLGQPRDSGSDQRSEEATTTA